MEAKKRRARGAALNLEILPFPEKGSVQGTFMGVTELKNEDGTPKMGKFGQALAFFSMSDLDTGEITQYWMNGGFVGAFKLARLSSGMDVEIEHTGYTPHPEWGTEIATYRVYRLVNEK